MFGVADKINDSMLSLMDIVKAPSAKTYYSSRLQHTILPDSYTIDELIFRTLDIAAEAIVEKSFLAHNYTEGMSIWEQPQWMICVITASLFPLLF